MFDAMSLQDIAVAIGFVLCFGVGVLAGLLS
jgi:hypothetical protein